jgi:acetylornithine deacetylase/succinyl-diaminopimelate desuccinylase-like protein
MEVEAQGPARDLHSGMFGGAAPNAVYGLIELLSKAKDADGRILIPGMYDDVAAPDQSEIESWNNLPFSESAFLKNEVGASALTGEPQQSVLARIWARPTFEVHGIAGGFTGAGAKTVIPAKAVAKVSMRLVPNQKPDKILAAFQQWIQEHTPKGIQTSVRVLSSNPAISVNPRHSSINTAAKAFSDVMGRPTVFIRAGGSIPIVGEFAQHLGIPTVLMGFGLPDDGLHSPNEKYRIFNYYLGIRTLAHFLDEYGKTA